MRKQRKNERKVRLKAWLANHSAISVAADCKCTRDAISKAHRNEERDIWLFVNDKDRVTYAFEYVGIKPVFGFRES